MRLTPLLLAASILSAPLTVFADEETLPSGVVLRFEGRGAAKMRNVVVRAVAPSLTLTPRKQVEASAAELGADLETRRGRARVAGALGLALLVEGEVRGSGAKTRVAVRVYSARGKVAAEREVSVPPSAAGRRALAAAAREAVAEAIESAVPRGTEAEAPAPEASRDDPTEADEDDAPAEAARSAPASERPLFRFLVGAGGRTRDVEVDLESGGRRRFESGVFLEIPVTVEARPLAKLGEAASGFSVLAHYAHGVALAASEPGGDELEASAYRVGVHVGYDRSIGRGGLGALVGFAYDSFQLEANPVLPSLRSPILRAGLFGSYALVGRALGARIDAGFRRLFSLGPLGDAFGRGGDGLGFDARLSLGGDVRAFSYSLGAGYAQSWLRFSGAADDAPARAGSERGFTLAAQLGFRIGASRAHAGRATAP